MIKGFIQRIFSRRRAQVAVPATAAVIDPKLIKPRIVDAAAYNISARMISRGARETCEGLQRAGYRAFVVGGAVRDLLLDAHPKDFDVATDATPEQVRDVFRRARIIGRRFRLVHVMFGPETLRSTP
jgi:poly(A) polymerase